MRATVLLLLLMLSASVGCVDNMDSFKEFVGAKDPPPTPPPPPPVLPPEVRMQANVTSIVAGGSIHFTSEGTRDPQGLPLTFLWTFGDGATGTGADILHTFATAGEFRVTLRATNSEGAADEERLVVQVGAADRAPLVLLTLTRPDGSRVESLHKDEAFRYDTTGSRDPEGGPLTYDWDFGDGTTSHAASGGYAFTTPGLFTVKLRAVDRDGLASEASRIVAVDAEYAFTGEFEVTSEGPLAHTFPLAEGAALLNVTLTFPASLGGNDLTLVLRDEAGQEVERTSAQTRPGTQGDETRSIELAGEALRAERPGDWTIGIVRTKGVQLTYTVTARETF